MKKMNLMTILCCTVIISACTANIPVTPTGTPQPTNTPEPTPTPTLTPTPTPNPIEDINGRLLFRLYNIGILIFDPKTQSIEMVADDIGDISDVSKDGKIVLLKNDKELYLLDLSQNRKVLISDFLFTPDEGVDYTNSQLIEDSKQIIFIGEDPANKSPRIFISDYEGKQISPVSTDNKLPFYLLGYRDNAIYWMQGEIREDPGEEVISVQGIVKTNIHGGDLELEIDKYTYDFKFSENGEFLVYSKGGTPPTIVIRNYNDNKELILMGMDSSLDPDLEEIIKNWAGYEQMEFIWSPKSNFFLFEIAVTNFEIFDPSKNDDFLDNYGNVAYLNKVYTKDGQPLQNTKNLIEKGPLISDSSFSLDENHLIVNYVDSIEFWDFQKNKKLYTLSASYLVKEVLKLDSDKGLFGKIFPIP